MEKSEKVELFRKRRRIVSQYIKLPDGAERKKLEKEAEAILDSIDKAGGPDLDFEDMLMTSI